MFVTFTIEKKQKKQECMYTDPDIDIDGAQCDWQEIREHCIHPEPNWKCK